MTVPIEYKFGFVDRGAAGGIDNDVVSGADKLSVHQDIITMDFPPSLQVVAELYVDGRVIASSYPTTLGPPRRNGCIGFYNFEFPPVSIPANYYGIRYRALLPDGRSVPCNLDPPAC